MTHLDDVHVCGDLRVEIRTLHGCRDEEAEGLRHLEVAAAEADGTDLRSAANESHGPRTKQGAGRRGEKRTFLEPSICKKLRRADSRLYRHF